MTAQGTPRQTAPPTGRLRLGLAILVVGFLIPLLVPLVAASDLPATWKAMLSGILLVGVPELFMVVAVAVLGKPGFEYLKTRLLALVKRHALPRTVSRTRYRIGLVLFLIPFGLGWLAPYVGHLVPGYEANAVYVALAGDLVLLAGLCVIGGEFWDKLRALATYDAQVSFAAPKGRPSRP